MYYRVCVTEFNHLYAASLVQQLRYCSKALEKPVESDRLKRLPVTCPCFTKMGPSKWVLPHHWTLDVHVKVVLYKRIFHSEGPLEAFASLLTDNITTRKRVEIVARFS